MRLVIGLSCVLLLSVAGGEQAAGATTYDLKAQWSKSGVNPNGPWSLVQGMTPLPYVKVWTQWKGATGRTISQPAFAPGPITNVHPGDYLPGWFKAVAALTDSSTSPPGGWMPGDVVVHTTDQANGDDNGPAAAVFTAPAAGQVTISGYEYSATFANRPQAWAVLRNGLVLASGTDPNDGSVNRSHRNLFTLKQISINPGDVISLTVYRAGSLGYFMGADLKIVYP